MVEETKKFHEQENGQNQNQKDEVRDEALIQKTLVVSDSFRVRVSDNPVQGCTIFGCCLAGQFLIGCEYTSVIVVFFQVWGKVFIADASGIAVGNGAFSP